MNPTKTLHNLGQSLWLDNITRDLLNSGTLQRYIDEFSVTGAPLGISPSAIIQRRNLPTRKRLSPVRGTFFRKKTRMLVESKSSGLRMACRSFHR